MIEGSIHNKKQVHIMGLDLLKLGYIIDRAATDIVNKRHDA